MFIDLLKNIQTKAKDFDANLIRIKTLNDGLLNRTEKLIAELDCLLEKVNHKNAPPKCTICYTRPKAMCFVSCGHIVCCECADRAKNGRMRCFTCRTPVSHIIRVYC